jgi:hypothetical protein
MRPNTLRQRRTHRHQPSAYRIGNGCPDHVHVRVYESAFQNTINAVYLFVTKPVPNRRDDAGASHRQTCQER